MSHKREGMTFSSFSKKALIFSNGDQSELCSVCSNCFYMLMRIKKEFMRLYLADTIGFECVFRSGRFLRIVCDQVKQKELFLPANRLTKHNKKRIQEVV